MKDLNLSDIDEQTLRNQVISDDQPGTVLRDFSALLEIVKARGIAVGGKTTCPRARRSLRLTRS